MSIEAIHFNLFLEYLFRFVVCIKILVNMKILIIFCKIETYHEFQIISREFFKMSKNFRKIQKSDSENR